jgi:FkbM family methyltransferase
VIDTATDPAGRALRGEAPGRRKVYLDIGAHFGETLPAALDPRFGFDVVVCFEPASRCWPRLRRRRDPRILLCRFGLSNESGRRPLYAAGSVRASVLEEGKTAGAPAEVVTMARASDWFRTYLGQGDEVYAKVNVEGSECDILEDLLDTKEISKVRSMLVDFDVRRFPSRRHREVEVKDRLAREGVRVVVDARDVQAETLAARARRWLASEGAEEPALSPLDRLRSAAIGIRFELLPRAVRALGLPRAARRFLPPETYARMRSAVLGNWFRPSGRR